MRRKECIKICGSTLYDPRKPAAKKPKELIAQQDPVVVPAVAAPVLTSDSLVVLGEFLFETNSATLKGEQFFALDSLMDFLLAHPSLVIKISGHTDTRGNESHNKTLSFKRAEVVAEYLVDNGVAIERVTFEGMGSTKPLMPNTTEAGRRKNRRVELLIHDRR